MRWAYFDVAGKCLSISDLRIMPGEHPHPHAYEKQVPDEYKPNTTAINTTTQEVYTFPRPEIPPPVVEPGSFAARLAALEERVTKLENS